MALIVTGGSGEFGRLATEALLEKADPGELIVVSRKPAALATLAERGVTVRFGDFDEPETLRSAFAGGSRMLLISATDVGPRRRRQHRTAIEAAASAGVRHIAYTSSAGIHPRNPSFVIPDHIFTEQLLGQSGLDVTILRINSYADILAKAIAPQAIATGRWVGGAGDGLVGFVAKEDCASAAAAVLTSGGHEGAVYEISGPELLSHRDAARIASEISGRPIDYVTVEDNGNGAGESFVAAEVEQASKWIGSFTVEDLKSFEYAVLDGYYAICTRHVEMITGRPALSLRDVYVANAQLLVPGVRSAAPADG